jgi:hypothetical protein
MVDDFGSNDIFFIDSLEDVKDPVYSTQSTTKKEPKKYVKPDNSEDILSFTVLGLFFVVFTGSLIMYSHWFIHIK